MQIRDINEIIGEIDKLVTNVETWAAPGVPSSFFCILHKLMSMNLNGISIIFYKYCNFRL